MRVSISLDRPLVVSQVRSQLQHLCLGNGFACRRSGLQYDEPWSRDGVLDLTDLLMMMTLWVGMPNAVAT